MLFSSVVFIWAFLPAVLAVYYLIAKLPMKGEEKKRTCLNTVLLLASLVFYGFGGAIYLLLLAAVLIVNYVGGRLLESVEDAKRKYVCVLTILVDLAILFHFKYMNLFIMIAENVQYAIVEHDLGGAWHQMLTMTRTGELGIADIIFPIGISFYILQAISYVVDVYRKKVNTQRSFANFALYVSFFPQLIAGPIVQYADVAYQIEHRKESTADFSEGVSRFIYGLSKKVLISNACAQMVDSIWATGITGIGASVAWLGSVSYAIQIYFDFSGYSDMAIGLGKMFGFHFKENFLYPFSARSAQDLWSRWHISLFSWLREYVYFPLGGSRCSKVKNIRNMFLVFFLSGLWHGANFTFLIWGSINGIIVILEKLFYGKYLKKNKWQWLNVIYVNLVFILTVTIFRSDNIVQAFTYIREMFRAGNGEYSIFSFLRLKSSITLIAGAVLAMPVYPKLKENRVFQKIEIPLQMLLLLYAIMLIISGTYNPFIYFQF